MYLIFVLFLDLQEQAQASDMFLINTGQTNTEQTSSNKHITLHYQAFIKAPLKALLTWEHELPHAEQFAEYRAQTQDIVRDYPSPWCCDATYTTTTTFTDKTLLLEYETDFVATQFHPCPLAMYNAIKRDTTFGNESAIDTSQCFFLPHGGYA